MLKATPHMEGAERFIYLEASDESRDYQNEVVLRKALEESQDYFLKYGNLDLDHITQVGPVVGIDGYELFEIGIPVEVKFDGPSTFVKGRIYSGEGPVAERANMFWDSVTKLDPPQRWFPSVGGHFGEHSRRREFDSETGRTLSTVHQVRWTNVGFSKTPVNSGVRGVSTIPFGVLAKCWGPHGLDMAKALEAGYGTDAASLEGGAALRKQSLLGADTPVNYMDFREAVSRMAVDGRLKTPNARRIFEVAVSRWGVSRDTAAKWVERFMRDLKHGLERRSQT